MATVAKLCALVDRASNLFRIGRETDLACCIDDAEPYHSRLVGNGGHHLVKRETVIAHHVVRGTAYYDVADASSVAKRRFFDGLARLIHVHPAKSAEGDRHGDSENEDQLGANRSSRS